MTYLNISLTHPARELCILAQISCKVQEKWPQSCKTLHESYKSTLARLLASLAVVQDIRSVQDLTCLDCARIMHARSVQDL